MDKGGRVVLLGEEHSEKQNPWGKSVVGWRPNSQGVGGIHNLMGFSMMRVVVQKSVKGEMTDLYDQPMLVENAGSIVIAELGGHIGLVRVFRMVGERILPDAGADYIRRLQEEKRWEELAASLGRWCWEAPRGLAPSGLSSGEAEDQYIIRTAKLEALEEAGFRIDDVRIVGRVNVNPTFFAHSQFIVHAKVVSVGNNSPENLEIIGDRKFFTMEELRNLNRSGEFDDGLTLAAMAACGFSL